MIINRSTSGDKPAKLPEASKSVPMQENSSKLPRTDSKAFVEQLDRANRRRSKDGKFK